MSTRPHTTKAAVIIPAFGPRLIEAMTLRGVKREEVCRRLRYSGSTIAAWRNGRSMPRAHQLVVLADLLDVSVDWLLGRE